MTQIKAMCQKLFVLLWNYGSMMSVQALTSYFGAKARAIQIGENL